MIQKISTKIELIEGLRDILVVEKLARTSYEQDLLTFKNFKLRDTIEAIKKDEDRHVQIIEELLLMLER